MENSIAKLKNDKSSFSSVLEKYLRLQNERTRPDNSYKDVRLSVNLLDRFVQGESLNQVVITLYPRDEGYTLALKIQNTLESETAPIPYEEDELLNCINNQQLPPVLVELLEEAGADVFYDGCVFVEVKDLRDNSKHTWNVLLKPSPQSILADAQQICQEQGWGSEELVQLESILCMAVAEPLCLNPNPSLGELAVNRDSTSKQLHSPALRRSRRRWSEGRKRKQIDTNQSCNNDFKLHDFLKKKSLLGRGIPPILQAQEDKNGLPSTSTPAVQLDVSDVLRLAKPLERPKETGDCSMIPCEEYLYETDRVNGRVYLVRLIIFQRPAIEEFLGQLYVDRDFRDGKLTGGASCMFTLGSRIHVNRYIQQFTEIFTEEGRKSVKITHQVQGHPPRVMYTHSMREKERLREKEEKQQQLQQQQQQQQPVAQSINKDTTEAQPVNTTPITTKTENHQTSGTLTKTALLESLKSGQVSPAIATLVSSLLTSAQQQQQQQQPIRQPVAATASLNTTNVVLTNGHHHQLQQQQSLLRTSAVVRPATTVAASTGPINPGQNVQLVTQPFSLQQAQQPQLRPNVNVRPTALAALLTNSKATTLPPNISAGKGKFVTIDGGTNGSTNVAAAGTSGGNTVLMGQVVRPVVNNTAAPVLPSYSQAIGQTTAGTTVVRAIRPAVHPSATGAGVVRRATETVAVNGSGSNQRFSLTVPALSALLAGTPSADSPGGNNVAVSQNLPTLLERLQHQQTSPSKPIVNALNNNHHQLHAIKPGLNMSNNNLNVQSINLSGVQGAVANLPTLQSIQVSIPGLAVPLSLSLAVTSSGTSGSTTVSTAGVMGNVRLTAAAGSLGGAGQPISIPLSILQQIPNASGTAGVQLMGNVTTKDGTQGQPLKVAVTSGAGVAQLSSGGQSSGSLIAQQQLQMALQRQVQLQLQQKMAAKQKSKPPNS